MGKLKWKPAGQIQREKHSAAAKLGWVTRRKNAQELIDYPKKKKGETQLSGTVIYDSGKPLKTFSAGPQEVDIIKPPPERNYEPNWKLIALELLKIHQ